MIGGPVLAVETGYTRGHGGVFHPLGQHNRPKVIVPDEGKDQNWKGGDRGPDQGQHHEPANPPLRHALNAGRFDQLKRQGADKVAHEQGAKPGLKRDVE